MGEGAVLLHRGLADNPTYLHARDAACVEGLAHRAALQAPAHVAQPRGDAGDRLEERAAARRLRRHHAQVHGRAGLDEPSGGPGARAAAFTSDAKAKWAVLWLRWRDFNKFWSQLVRWTLRSGSRSDTVALVERHDDVGEIVVDAVDTKGEFINFLDSQVGVVAPNRERTVIDLEQVGPGRYRGRFPITQEGVYLVGMSQRRGDRVIGSQLAGLVVPYAQELRDLGVDEALLRELAELTGGSALASPRDAFLTG